MAVVTIGQAVEHSIVGNIVVRGPTPRSRMIAGRAPWWRRTWSLAKATPKKAWAGLGVLLMALSHLDRIQRLIERAPEWYEMAKEWYDKVKALLRALRDLW